MPGIHTIRQVRSYRTAYLWEEVLARDSLLDVLARFIHLQIEEKRDDRGRKVKAETMIFPRYHQLDAVRLLVQKARCEGVGNNYLIEHSAGSGKSNTIGWLAHRLASLHNEANERVFDSVIVVTDRVVLDQQLQDTIYQFEHKLGVVQKIDERSRQLAEALENAVPIIITTLQKFPFVSQQLLKMAEEQGVEGTGVLPTRRCAVIIDEAHSSQGGEASTDLKEVLGGEDLLEEARKRARGRRPRGSGGTVPQHGQTRPASEPEFLRFHGHAQTQDPCCVRPRMESRSIATQCAKRSRKGSSSTCSSTTPRTRPTSNCLRRAKKIQTSSGRKQRWHWRAFCACTPTTSRKRPR